MKRFHFRLQAALEWRETQQRVEESRLEALLGQAQALDNEAVRCDSDRAAAEAAVLSAIELRPQELASLDAYARHLTLEKARFRREAQQARDSAAAQRQRLVEARRQVKLLEKLKERQQAQWQSEFTRELDNEAADLFLAKWSEPEP